MDTENSNNQPFMLLYEFQGLVLFKCELINMLPVCRQNLIFRVTCSKGTYIRSLCADLGKALGRYTRRMKIRRNRTTFCWFLTLHLAL